MRRKQIKAVLRSQPKSLTKKLSVYQTKPAKFYPEQLCFDELYQDFIGQTSQTSFDNLNVLILSPVSQSDGIADSRSSFPTDSLSVSRLISGKQAHTVSV